MFSRQGDQHVSSFHGINKCRIFDRKATIAREQAMKLEKEVSQTMQGLVGI